ncbi:MAG: hypothetical protein DDT29_02271 [Dehalococcoidia bacterium]|nr:hypothetical protein [Bacillota bacterium]
MNVWEESTSLIMANLLILSRQLQMLHNQLDYYTKHFGILVWLGSLHLLWELTLRW